MASSATQRSLKECRDKGWPAQVVERWNAFARVRQDLFGMVDILALDGQVGILGIQTTTTPAAERIRKMTANPILVTWLKAGNRMEVWSWVKRKRGGPRLKWSLRIIRLTLPEGYAA